MTNESITHRPSVAREARPNRKPPLDRCAGPDDRLHGEAPPSASRRSAIPAVRCPGDRGRVESGPIVGHDEREPAVRGTKAARRLDASAYLVTFWRASRQQKYAAASTSWPYRSIPSACTSPGSPPCRT